MGKHPKCCGCLSTSLYLVILVGTILAALLPWHSVYYSLAQQIIPNKPTLLGSQVYFALNRWGIEPLNSDPLAPVNLLVCSEINAAVFPYDGDWNRPVCLTGTTSCDCVYPPQSVLESMVNTVNTFKYLNPAFPLCTSNSSIIKEGPWVYAGRFAFYGSWTVLGVGALAACCNIVTCCKGAQEDRWKQGKRSCKFSVLLFIFTGAVMVSGFTFTIGAAHTCAEIPWNYFHFSWGLYGGAAAFGASLFFMIFACCAIPEAPRSGLMLPINTGIYQQEGIPPVVVFVVNDERQGLLAQPMQPRPSPPMQPTPAPVAPPPMPAPMPQPMPPAQVPSAPAMPGPRPTAPPAPADAWHVPQGVPQPSFTQPPPPFAPGYNPAAPIGYQTDYQAGYQAGGYQQQPQNRY